MPHLLLATLGTLFAVIAPILLVAHDHAQSLELRFHLALLAMLGGSASVLAVGWLARRRQQQGDQPRGPCQRLNHDRSSGILRVLR